MSAQKLLVIDGLTVSFDGTESPVVNNVSLSLNRGEILGVVGESGSGKTMISKAVMRLLPQGGAIRSGSVRLDDTELTTLDVEAMRRVRGRNIGMIFQEPMMSLNPAMKIGRQMREAFAADSTLRETEQRAQMLEMLQRVQMPDPAACLQSYPHEFSGGMRQRIMLATALLMQPRLLIADEPTTALDVLIQKEVLDRMIELVNDMGTAVILISHDLGLVAQYADRICVMQNGRVVEQATTTKLLSRPQQPYTQELLNSVPTRAKSAPKSKTTDRGEPTVRIEDLHVRFGSRSMLPWKKPRIVHAVNGVSAALYSGETLAVVGESGSGKTTLGRAVLKLVEAEQGSIRVGETEITSIGKRAMRPLRSKLQIVYQDPFSSLDPRMRVDQIVAEGLRNSGMENRQCYGLVRKTLDEVGLSEEFGARFPHQLSGGQRQRVGIARAIIMRPDVIVTDEAVSALDVTVQARVLDLLATLQRRYGFSYLFITHDISVVDQIADRVLVMYRGRVVESGPKESVLDSPGHPYTCRLLEAVPRLRRNATGGLEAESLSFETPPLPTGFAEDQSYHGDVSATPELIKVSDDHFVACSRA